MSYYYYMFSLLFCYNSKILSDVFGEARLIFGDIKPDITQKMNNTTLQAINKQTDNKKLDLEITNL